MITFLKIAWRNITRNKWRSFITISAVAMGLAGLIFIQAFVDGGQKEMVRNYTDLITTHLQIHAKGFHKNMGLEFIIKKPQEIEAVSYTHLTLPTTPYV